MSSEPTGRVQRDGDLRTLILTRDFRAPITDVWAAVTEPERLARWIGTFEGDPLSGRVAFRMTAEGQEESQPVDILACVPPHRLALILHTGGQAGEGLWHVELTLAEADGVTTLTFSQRGIDPVAGESVGPGWEYYLDRLIAAETGGEVDAVDFDRDYYPAMVDHYRAQLA